MFNSFEKINRINYWVYFELKFKIIPFTLTSLIQK